MTATTMDRADAKNGIARTRAQKAAMDVFAAKAADAKQAIDEVFVNSDKDGLPQEQVQAIANATQEVLVRQPGFDDRAKRALSEGGFTGDELEELFSEIMTAAA